MRTGYFKQAVRALQSLSEDERNRILSALKPETLRAIDSDVDVGWVPLELNADFTESVYRVTGAVGARAYGRRVGNSSFDTPILRGLMEATIRLFGIGPKGLLKVLRRSWNAVYRNCGEIEVEADAGNAVQIVLRDCPALLCTPSYVESVSGGLEATFDFCSVDGEVKAESKKNGVTWVATWRERRRS